MYRKNSYLDLVDDCAWPRGPAVRRGIWSLRALMLAAGTAYLALASPGDLRVSAQTAAATDCTDAPDTPAEAAIEACTAKLAIKDIADADAAAAYAVRAAIHARQGHPRRAIDDFTQAIRKRSGDVSLFVRRAALYRAIEDDDRAISDLDEAIKLEPMAAQHLFDRAELFRKKGDRRRAFIDYGAVLKLDPGFEGATGHRRTLAREIERAGALMPVAARPSFECSTAQRAVEKAICTDLELSQLDRDLDAAFRSALANAVPETAKTIRTDQENFVATRNMSFGQAGYDLKRAMTRRLAALRAQAN